MRILLGGLCALLLAVSMSGQPVNAAGSCEALSSLALPNAYPTLPLRSPTTINALKLKRRPPFTTFEQRLT